MRRSAASLSLLVCLCVPGSALALTIDDFEVGNFNVVDVAPGPTLGQQAGLAPNVIGGARLVRSNATNGGTTTASLTTTAGPDGAQLSFSDAAVPFGQGDVSFLYDGIPDGGANGPAGALNLDLSVFSSIDVEATATPGIASLQLTLWDSAGSQALPIVPIANGTNSFLLSGFNSVDLTNIKTIRVAVFGLDPSESLSIDHISAVPEPGTALLLGIGLIALSVRNLRAR